LALAISNHKLNVLLVAEGIERHTVHAAGGGFDEIGI
jgi:hypothetical protein